MKKLNDNAEWILLMGLIVSFAIIFLAILLNLSVQTGQTASESVAEFPKSQIRDLRAELTDAAITSENAAEFDAKLDAIRRLALYRDNAVADADVTYGSLADEKYGYTELRIHYSNGVTEYDEVCLLPKKL
ncbi:MAG: hypothetical protein IKS74_03585 [Methanomicrobium sp.]|nr:hypothetical protein [Methanomicrobium sp.]